MHGVMIVTVVFACIVLALGIICGTLISLVRLRQGGGISRQDRHRQTDEARMVQEIYNGLSKLEERVESLETILMDGNRKDRKS